MELKPNVVSKPCENPNGCRGTLRPTIEKPVAPSVSGTPAGGGALWRCDTCGAETPYMADVPGPGDTLVVEKPNGRAEMLRLDGSGQWTVVRGGDEDLSNPHAAWEIARANFGPGGN